MRPQYWLTWKRGGQLYSAWVIATFPLVVTVIGSAIISIPLPWTSDFSVEILAAGVVISLVIWCGVYRFTRAAAEVLYYPPLHQRTWLAVSTISLVGVGIGVTYFSYLVFLVPLSHPIIPELGDVGVGLVLASGYTLFLSAWRTRTLRNEKEVVAETEMASRIREPLQRLRSDNPSISDTEVLIDGLQSVAEQYEREPMMDSSEPAEVIWSWCDECSASNSLISRLRMIPDTDRPPTTERTKEQIARFQELENDLHTMNILSSKSDQ